MLYVLVLVLITLTVPISCVAGLNEANQYYQNKQYPAAIAEFLPLANAGNIEAQTKLGLMYTFGQGTAINYAQGFRYFSLASSADDPKAIYWVGIYLLNGYGMPKAPEKSVAYFEKAANKGYVEAQSVLGIMYMEGIGVTRDYATAFSWNSVAANNGHPVAMYHVGQLFEKGAGIDQDDKAAVFWYALAAKQNDTNAEFEMGVAYANGIGGLQKDINLAISYYSKAANKGAVTAQHNLALIYVQQAQKLQEPAKTSTLQEAIGWLKKASEAGSGNSTFLLAHYYSHGIGVVKDEIYAEALLKKASDQGYSVAQKEFKFKEKKEIHMVYRDGAIVEDRPQTNQMLVNAFNNWKQLAEQGDSNAIRELAIAYQYGQGVNQDLAKAAEHYIKLYKNPQEPDFYVFDRFSRIYRDGLIGKDAKSAQAKELINKQAETLGNSALIRFIARCHYCHSLDGPHRTSEKNTMQQQWYAKAALMGDVKAKLALTDIHKNQMDYAILANQYHDLVDKHDVDAAKYHLAYLYLYGVGVPKNEVMARDLLLKINDKEKIEPQLFLARMYANGGAMVKDSFKAQQMYLFIANHQKFYPDNSELMEAAGHLAEYYFYADGKVLDYQQAYFWKKLQIALLAKEGRQYIIGTVHPERCFYEQEQERFPIKPFAFVEEQKTEVIKSDINRFRAKLNQAEIQKMDLALHAWITQHEAKNINVAP